MRVFSYIVVSDSGFAPNPFHGLCTLACCKPKVRRSAQFGDLIFGLTPKALGHRLVYAMEVAERIPVECYWHRPEFVPKRPNLDAPTLRDRQGDNAYEPLGNGVFRQHPCRHSNKDRTEDPRAMAIDLGPARDNPVLVGSRFRYFGREAIPLPAELSFLLVGRSHRCRFTPEQVELAKALFAGLPQGIQGCPHRWREGDESWRPAVGATQDGALASGDRWRGSGRGCR